MDQPSVRVIYVGGYISDLGILDADGGSKGWLVYRHPEGQWVTLADLKQHTDLLDASLAGEKEE